MDHRDYCIQIFKPILDQYKKNKTPASAQESLAETYTPDYILFKKMQKAFTVLGDVIKYVVLKDEKYYNETLKNFDISEDPAAALNELTINVPSNVNDLLTLYMRYPAAIDAIHEDLYNIINVKDYEALLMLRKINVLLYYSVITDTETAEKILFFEDTINLFSLLVHELVKKLMRGHIEMVVGKKTEEKAARVSQATKE